MAGTGKRPRNLKTNWNLTEVKARQALKLMPVKAGKTDWGDVDVAQIDTGYRPHATFGSKPRSAGHLRIADGINYKEADAPADPLDPMDYAGKAKNPGHGARICSMICGLPVKQGSQVLFHGGVAPGLPVIPYRTTNTVTISPPVATKREVGNVAAAVRHAVEFNGADVINMSLGTIGAYLAGKALSTTLGRAIDFAYEHGVIVCAAGGQITSNVTYPGKYYRTIGCGGIDPDRTMWNNADQGYEEHDLVHIDVWAPANHLRRPEFDAADSYQDSWGTSYATAHVTAAAAMWLRLHARTIALKYAEPWMRIEAFRALLKATHTPMEWRADDPGNTRPYPGTGILNILKLLKAPLPEPGELKPETRPCENMHW